MRLALPRPSIARRLLAGVLLAYLLVWVVVGGIGIVATYTTGSGDYDREMMSLAKVVDTLTADPAVRSEVALRAIALKVAEDGRRLGAEGAHLGFQVHDTTGALLSRGGADAPALPADRPAGFFEIQADGESWWVLRLDSADGQRRIDVTEAHAIRNRILRTGLLNSVTLVQLLIGFPVLVLPIWLAVRTGLAPLSRLSQVLTRRQPGELEPVHAPVPYRELMPVVEALNATLVRLSELLRRERAFLADAAHELRTPLAVISAQCDTLRQAPSGAAHEAAMQRLGLGVARSVRLVNQLLALARLEADVETKLAPVDLADMARDCLALNAAAAAERSIELSYQGCDSLATWSPGHSVEAVLHNLVSNAIRYGRAGGQVEVTLSQQEADDCVLSVSDDGPGIPAEDHSRVFERFWRGATADPPATGSGLGLSIVLAASRQLGARIELGEGLNGAGLRVSLHWRLIAAAAAATNPA